MAVLGASSGKPLATILCLVPFLQSVWWLSMAESGWVLCGIRQITGLVQQGSSYVLMYVKGQTLIKCDRLAGRTCLSIYKGTIHCFGLLNPNNLELTYLKYQYVSACKCIWPFPFSSVLGSKAYMNTVWRCPESQTLGQRWPHTQRVYLQADHTNSYWRQMPDGGQARYRV